MADRVDPLAGVPGLVEPVRVVRLHLDHALDGPDGERGRAGGEELPQVPLRLRHPNEPRLEDREPDVGGEAPVAEAHDPGAHAGRHLVPLAHVVLGHLVVPAVLDEAADRDPVPDQRDVEDREPHGGEPERALREPLARERPADDARQHEPAEARREQRAAADDHHVGVREVADEVARVAGACEGHGHPGHVLHDHVHGPEDEEEATPDEVLRHLAVVGAELLVRVGDHPNRRRLPRHEPEHGRDDDGEERRVGQELERREVAQIHAPRPTEAQALRSRRRASSRGRRP